MPAGVCLAVFGRNMPVPLQDASELEGQSDEVIFCAR